MQARTNSTSPARRRTPRVLAAVWGLAALAASSCAAKGGEFFDYSTLACKPGDSTACPCQDNDGRGVSYCLADGSGWSDCQQCTGPGHCTDYPNCAGCFGCLDTCLCQDEHKHPDACKTRCANEGSDGSSVTATCEVSACPASAIQGVGTPCCTTDQKCGFVIQFVGSNCIEANQPGSPDPSCPAVSPISGFSLQGCCRPDGVCGGLDTFLGLGCVDPTTFGGQAGPSCTPP